MRSLEDYWELLRQGRDAITTIGPERWATNRYWHPRAGTPGRSYTWAAGVIEGIDQFEPQFFGISPREANQMDPQQRMLLELAWEALEHGAQAPSRLAGSSCGVFVGISARDYADLRFDDPASGDAYAMSGTTLSIAANRISHCLDLRGPSMAVDTACSSSLVALHLACQSLWRGESSSALAGGAHLLLSPFPFIGFSSASMLSRRGRSRSFDAGADGYVRGEGGVLVYLRPLRDALRDGDPVLATILATGVNTAGRTDSLTVPGFDAQVALLRSVHAAQGLAPAGLSYLEAHGTGTPVGDPIEAAAIGTALGAARGRDGALPIGSVKSNIGHLEPASGIAGLLKVVLQLRHAALVPTVHLDVPNPSIDFTALNLRVVDRFEPLPTRPAAHLMGVSSFGFGGANAHVLVREAPAATPRPEAKALGQQRSPLLLSAHSQPALRAMAAQFAELIERQQPEQRYETLWTCALRRERHAYRLVVDGPADAQMITALRAHASNAQSGAERCVTGLASGNGAVAFVFSGNGSQWAGMGRTLMEESATFRRCITEVQTLLKRHVSLNLAAEICADAEDSRIALTEVAQPVLFALQVGVVAMLREQGLVPDMVMGHSVGEVAAAYAAGALSLADAVLVIAKRSGAQARTRGAGRMIALALDAPGAMSLCAQVSEDLELAAVNSPVSVTVAGPGAAIEELATRARAAGHRCQVLGLDYAFHSRAMDCIAEELRTELAGLTAQTARIPFISTVDGAPRPAASLDAEYWWHNVRQPVQLASALNHAMEAGAGVFVEVGPRPLTRGYVAEAARVREVKARYITSMDVKAAGAGFARRAAFEAFCVGRELQLPALFSQPAAPVALPAYPWQRQSYWYAHTSESPNLVTGGARFALLGAACVPGELVWESFVDLDLQPWLADHRVQGIAVFPAAGFVEIALEAAAEAFPGEVLALEGMAIHAAMTLNDRETRCVRVSIDRDDGRVLIRSRRRLSDERWVLHVQARLLAVENTEIVPPGFAAAPGEARGARIDPATHYGRTDAAGLEYGPAFRTVRSVGAQRTVIDVDLALDAAHVGHFEHHLLAAPLLDGAFQALLHAAGDDDGAIETYVPIGVDRVRLDTAAGVPARGVLRVTGRTPRTVVADVLLLSAHGAVVAVLHGCRMRAVGRAARPAGRPPLYRFVRSVSVHADPAQRRARLAPRALAQQARAAFAAAAHDAERLRYHGEVAPLLEALSCALVLETLRELADGDPVGEDLGVLCEERGLTGAARAHLLGAAAWLDGYGLSWREALPREDSELQDPRAIWQLIATDYPQYLPELAQAPLMAQTLRRLLHGLAQVQGVEPGWPAAHAERVLAASPGAHVGHEAALRALRPVVDGWPASERLRVLDCGGRAGWLRPHLGRVLAEHVDWVLCANEPGLAEEARLIAERHGAQQAPDPEQALTVHGAFDVVAIGNAPLSADRRGALLSGARRALAVGGTLLLYGQAMQPLQRLFHVCAPAAGNAAGEADEVGLLSVRGWAELLRQAGFSEVELAQECADAEAPGGGFVLVASADEVALHSGAAESREPVSSAPDAGAPARRIQILEASPPRASAFAEALRVALSTRHGCVISVAPDLASAAFTTAAPEATTAHAGDGAAGGEAPVVVADTTDVVLLAGSLPGSVSSADGARPATAPGATDAAHTADDAVACLEVLHRVAAAGGAGGRLWVVAPDERRDPATGALRGLVRVAMNEHPELRISIVTLDPRLDPDTGAARVAEELQRSGEDREVVISARGRSCMVLVPYEASPAPGKTPAPSGQPAAWTLRLSGQDGLHGLAWQPCALPLPGPGQVLLRVLATGLNFRDVMFAQGVLPEEMIADGLAGPTLGLECAGEVVATGPGVDGPAVGSRVMCFAGQCFATHVVARADVCQPIPDGLSVSAAATVPTAFFTALYALGELARLRARERVLIHGAAGGVGMAAVQFARHCGAEVFATAGSDEKRAVLEMMGAAAVFDSRSLRFADEVLAATDGTGVDVVLNCLAGEALRRSVHLLAPFGRFLELGKRDFLEDTRLGLRPFRRNISYFGIDADQVLLHRPAVAREVLERMSALFASGALRPLPYREFPADRVRDAFVHVQQSRHLGKVVVRVDTLADDPPVTGKRAPRRRQLDGDGSYLVSGGTSGFGLASVQWLAQRGARNIVLASRSGGGEDAAMQASLAAVQDLGARVEVVAADVSDPAAVERLIATFGPERPALRGVIHAAAVIEDGLLANTDGAQLRRVLGPKAHGAWNLHLATRGLALELFVLYSSATTHLGSPGQGSYVAANAYLEALASHRHELGLPALAVAWGPIGDTGYLARHPEVRERLLLRSGTGALDAATALACLDELLAAGVDSAMVATVDWGVVRRLLPIARTPGFARVGQGRDGDVEESAQALRLRVQTSSEVAAQALLEQQVARVLGGVLHMDPADVDLDCSVLDIGLDSLMGMELMSLLNDRVGVELPTLILSEGRSARQIATELALRIRAPQPTADREGTQMEVRTLQQLAARHAEVVEEDVIERIVDEQPDTQTPRVLIH